MIPTGVDILDFNGRILTEEDIKSKVDELRKLVIENPKLNKLRTDDAYLLRFLHSCKFNVEEAYKKMESFYELLEVYPDWFQITSPEENKQFLERNMRLMLTQRDKEGRSIYVCKIGNVNPSKVTIKDVIRLDDLWLESEMDNPLTQCKGFSVIVDVSGYSYKLFQWLTPGNIKFGLKKMESLPVKEMLIHVVNTSFLLNASIKILWPFMNQKLKDSIKFHYNDWDSLHQYISPDVLPREYGGTGDLNYDKLNENLLHRSNEIVEKTKYIKFIVSNA